MLSSSSFSRASICSGDTRPPWPARPVASGWDPSGLADVRGLEALGPTRHFELDLVSLRQALEAARLDGAEVDEHVFATFLSDESVPLRVVEPLHLTLRHVSGPPCAPPPWRGLPSGIGGKEKRRAGPGPRGVSIVGIASNTS